MGIHEKIETIIMLFLMVIVESLKKFLNKEKEINSFLNKIKAH